MKLPFKKTHVNAKAPVRAHWDDAGLDLFWLDDGRYPNGIVLQSGMQFEFDTGIIVAINPSQVGLLWDKSGYGNKGVKVLGGVIDASYRSNIKVNLINLSDEPILFMPGQKLTQLLIQDVHLPDPEEYIAIALPPAATARGDGRYGSTGMF